MAKLANQTGTTQTNRPEERTMTPKAAYRVLNHAMYGGMEDDSHIDYFTEALLRGRTKKLSEAIAAFEKGAHDETERVYYLWKLLDPYFSNTPRGKKVGEQAIDEDAGEFFKKYVTSAMIDSRRKERR